MNFIKQIERLKRLNKLIASGSTGSPNSLAQRLHISRRQLYNILELLRDLGAPIFYNKSAQSYYYAEQFYLDIQFHIEVNQKEI